MLLRLSPYAVTPPTPRPSTITPLAYVMTNPARIRRGRQPARKADRQPAPSPFAVSRQPSASSFKPSIRQLPASSPAPHQRDENPPKSPPNRSADFSPVRREASSRRPRSPSPHAVADPTREAAQNPPAATPKVINIPVDNLLITC